MSSLPELLADYACVVGEGPLWHPMERRVYWTDIDTGRLFRYEPATGAHEQIFQGEKVGGFTVQADGSLLLFMARGAVKVWRAGELTTIIDEIPDERESRFNDVIADPEGRVFCGTMSTPDRPGRLYRLDTDGTLTKVLDGIGCSNGMGFTLNGTQMYYTDSTAKEIYLFDYDRATGGLSNQRLFANLKDELGVPDGMTVDAEGTVWSAIWDGSCLIRFAPDGSEMLRIPFPAKKVSCATFGGEDYTDMYVTTAGGDKKETDGEHAGALFRLNIGVRGVPEFFSKVRL
jgi:sugar lactone lactonase YvrE